MSAAEQRGKSAPQRTREGSPETSGRRQEDAVRRCVQGHVEFIDERERGVHSAA